MKIYNYLLFFCLSSNLVFSFNNEDSSKTSPKKLRTYTTTRITTEQPVIDGNLSDACWSTGVWAGDFTQWVPNEGAKPSKPTYLKILYDDSNIYVAINAVDEPDKIISKAGRRDEFNGDIVGVNFDSYHDRRTGFEFNITAAGQKIDLLLSNPINWDVNWNAVWYGKSAMHDSGWAAEYRIPLSQLRYSSNDEQVWGMHCWRWIDRLQEESDWEPQSSKGPGVLFQFGELHGIKGLPKSRRIEIMPYTLGKMNTFRKEPGNPFADDGRNWLGNVGVDAKIGLSSNFTADVTVNPDFGQVESDPSVMNLTAFETFYEERRPFFLEGRNIFDFSFGDNNLFYSRRIGHSPAYRPSLNGNEYVDMPDNTTILSAAKISGKSSNGLAIGILQSLTAKENATINSNGSDRDITIEPLTNYFIARVQKDYDAGNSVIGGIFTSTNKFINDSHLEFLNRNAYTGGIDLLHHWNDKEFYVSAKLIGSYINGSIESTRILQNSSARYFQRPDAEHLSFDSTATHLSGYGGIIEIGKGSKGTWRYSTKLSWRSPGLDLNDLGFMTTTDVIRQESAVSYFVTQPVSIFRTYTIALEQINNFNFGMEHLHSAASFRLYLEFLNNWAVNNRVTFVSSSLDDRMLRGGYAMKMPYWWSHNFFMRSDPSKKISFDISTNFSLSGNNNSANYSIQPGLTFMPMNTLRLNMSVYYSSNRDNLQYVDTKSVLDNDVYLLGKLNQNTLGITFRVDYNITPELSIQYYGSPFASVGKYSEFKSVSDPKASNYYQRFIIPPQVVINENNYDVYNDRNKLLYSFSNPNFNFSQFRSNLVLRWEYRPGSQVYVVWSSDRTYFANPSQGSVNNAISKIKDVYPNNIFLIKFNYWFTI